MDFGIGRSKQAQRRLLNWDSIRTLAARRGNPIETLTAESVSEAPTGTSRRTVNRLIRGKTREVLDELTSVVFPAIEFNRPDAVIYDDDELLVLETLLGVTGTAANGGAEIYGDYVHPTPDIDDLFFVDGPSGETLLVAIKDMKVDGSTRSRRWLIGARPAS